jgi:hypothetical protein
MDKVLLENWAEGILNIECNASLANKWNTEFELSYTDEEYSLARNGVITYMVGIEDYQNATKYLVIDDFRLLYYYDCSKLLHRISYQVENCKNKTLFTFHLEKISELFKLMPMKVVLVGRTVNFYEFLKEQPVFIDEIQVIKQKIFEWIRYSEVTRLNYLLNPFNWEILKDFDQEIAGIQGPK